MRFLFPSDYFNTKKVDEEYSEQVDCLRNIGLETSVISLEALSSGYSKIFSSARFRIKTNLSGLDDHS